MMAELGLKLIELNKLRGIWRAKGFEEAGWDDRLRINRYDCYVTFLRKNWVCKDLDGNILKSNPVLWTLLKSIT